MAHIYYTFTIPENGRWELDSQDNIMLNGFINNKIFQLLTDPLLPGKGWAKLNTEKTSVAFTHPDFLELADGHEDGFIKWEYVESKQALSIADQSASMAADSLAKAQIGLNTTSANKTAAQTRFDAAEASFNS